MANDAAHYRELAARAQLEADGATLDNVRERALRSAATFESMAVQHEKTALRRAERAAAAMPVDNDADIGVEPGLESGQENPKELL